ncbi:glycosyltransferase [Streptomyces platensis]|nr:glycosyltransferase [Streptomyces platensis]
MGRLHRRRAQSRSRTPAHKLANRHAPHSRRTAPDLLRAARASRGTREPVAPLLRKAGIRARYLGWLRRPQLWRAFAEHDVLGMPSTTLEAMGLVALEAQACGLPVLYQPVPGLHDALGTTAVATTDFTQPAAVARALERLRTPGVLPELREAGYDSAARYRLSATARALHTLGRQLTH